MSIIFGLLKERNETVSESELLYAATVTERYATGVGHLYAKGRIGMGLQPYFSHQRSEFEIRPLADSHGRMVSFDGRLDNYKELIRELALSNAEELDSRIVLAAFDRWGEECFSHLVGDWALALWSEKDQSLYLARDHAGTRTLYFRRKRGTVLWSSQLDTFEALDSELCLAVEYLARYLASVPMRDVTPYKGVCSVLPGHYATVRNGTISRRSHWNPIVRTTTCYKCDADYEAHFLSLFQQSVERRTGPGAPILAQLSGGMDSTSIVCMSDHLRRSTEPDAEILDTVSHYDDSDASLNERSYFTITEAKRGKIGTHLNTAFSQRTFEPHDATNGTYLLPGADSFSFHQERTFHEKIWRRGYRSILSGIGGDEVLGGIPFPFPELASHLVSGNAFRLLKQSIAWSLVDRSPLIESLYKTARYTVELYAGFRSNHNLVPPWLSVRLRELNGDRNAQLPPFLSRLGIAPYRLDNTLSWWSIMETLPHLFPQILSRPEYRYPFLDKDLVNFLFSIPREQVLKPGRRRSLMRRALVAIVPHEILERRRKAFQLRAPLDALRQAHPQLEKLFADSSLARAGLIDPQKLGIWLERTAKGDPEWRQALTRTIALELWMRTGHGRNSGQSPDASGGLHLSLTA